MRFDEFMNNVIWRVFFVFFECLKSYHCISFKIVVLFKTTTSTTILKEMRIAQLSSQNERTLMNVNDFRTVFRKVQKYLQNRLLHGVKNAQKSDVIYVCSLTWYLNGPFLKFYYTNSGVFDSTKLLRCELLVIKRSPFALVYLLIDKFNFLLLFYTLIFRLFFQWD